MKLAEEMNLLTNNKMELKPYSAHWFAKSNEI